MGQRFLRAVEVENADRPRPVVVRTHEVALPEGAVVHGDVREVQTVASAVRKLWSEGGFKSKNVVIGVGNQRVIARDLSMPKLPTMQQIREALPFQVQDLLPVPVGEALLDFYPIAEVQTDQGPTLNGILIAAIKESVLANVKAVQGAGLTPVNVDIVPFALARALVRGPLASANVVVLDIGSNTTNLIVCSDAVPQFVRMIPAGGDDITRALMNRMEVSAEQAEQFKSTRGLSTAAPATEAERAGAEAIFATTHELLTSIRNTMQYYTTLRPAQPLQAVVLSGGASHLPGLAHAVGEALRLQVVSSNTLDTVEMSKGAHRSAPEQMESMTVALGLALGTAA